MGVKECGGDIKWANELKQMLDGGIYTMAPPKTPTHEKFVVLHIITGFGKIFTCRTAEQLGRFIDNYKAEKKLKRDEDVNIQIGYGRMTQAEYDLVPECKYFDK